ncbi:hypothetical protein Tco_0998815 [Tanacetum coccineum]
MKAKSQNIRSLRVMVHLLMNGKIMIWRMAIMKDLQYLMMINMRKNRCQFMIPIWKMSLRKKKDLSGKEDLVGKKTTSKML